MAKQTESMVNAIRAVPGLELYIPDFDSATPNDWSADPTPVTAVLNTNSGAISFANSVMAYADAQDAADQALLLSGGATVQLPDRSYPFAGNQPFAVELFFQPTVVDANLRRIVSSEDFQSSIDVGWYLAYSTAGYRLVFADATHTDTMLATTTPTVGRTDHLFAIWNGAASGMYLYVNGSFGAPITPTATLPAHARALTLGGVAYAPTGAATFCASGYLHHLAVSGIAASTGFSPQYNGRVHQHYRISQRLEIRPSDVSEELYTQVGWPNVKGAFAYGPRALAYDASLQNHNYVVTGDPHLQAALRGLVGTQPGQWIASGSTF